MDTLLVNMTPDAASSSASKACVKAIERRIRADYTEVTRLGETALRQRIGKAADDPMLAWTAEEVTRARTDGTRTHDSVVLVDCRSETRTLDIVVTPAVLGLAHVQLRALELRPKVLALAAEAGLRRAWVGFTP
jgi:hypothetical protein